jgi:hypothetical protein
VANLPFCSWSRMDASSISSTAAETSSNDLRLGPSSPANARRTARRRTRARSLAAFTRATSDLSIMASPATPLGSPVDTGLIVWTSSLRVDPEGLSTVPLGQALGAKGSRSGVGVSLLTLPRAAAGNRQPVSGYFRQPSGADHPAFSPESCLQHSRDPAPARRLQDIYGLRIERVCSSDVRKEYPSITKVLGAASRGEPFIASAFTGSP